MRVSVIVPAYNEEKFIVLTLNSLAGALPGAQLIVVDDGSQDDTAAQAKGLAQVVKHHVNRGKAAALATGLGHCQGDIIAMVDGDMGSLAGEVAKLVEAVAEGSCDMAVALFASSRGGGLGLVRTVSRWGIFILTGMWLAAPLSGQRAAVRQVFSDCLPRRGGYGLETEFTVRALRRGWRVREIPTAFVHRGHGWTARGFLHRGRQFFDVVAALVRGGWPWS